MKKSELFTFLGIFLLVLGLGLYYRTYDLQLYLYKTIEQIEDEAEDRVQRFIDKQLIPQLKEKFPDLSKEEFEAKLEEARDALKQRDFDKYHDRFTRTLSTMPKSAAISGIYLLGADSYHYYDLSRRIAESGSVSESFKKGRYFHPARRAPFGLWRPLNLHPYGGYLWHRFISLFKSDTKLMESTALYGPMLYGIILVLFFILAKYLKGSAFGMALGGLTLAASPLLMQRTMLGWYDTDAYAFIFSYGILLCFLIGVKAVRKQAIILGIVTGFIVVLFSLFWQGWPFIFVIVFGTCVMGWILSRFWKDIGMPRVFPFTAAFLGSFLFFEILHRGPVMFYHLVVGIVNSVLRFSSRDTGGWPDMFIIVRETQSVAYDKIISHASGNDWIIGVAIFGAIAYAYKAFKKQTEHGWTPWIAMMIAAFGSVHLSLKTERFSLLCVIPLAVLAMWGMDGIQDLFGHLFKKFSKKDKKPWLSFVASLLVLIMIIPFQMQAAMQRIRDTDLRFFDDAWFHVLGRIEKETPKDAHILSWWPSGYIVTGVGERKVFTDGGTQGLPEAYWSARFYFAQDERDALGIFRMLNAAGNQAATFLTQEKGFELDKAINLIWKVIITSRQKAYKKLPKNWDAQTRESFLDKTHGKEMPPSYVMVYQDIVRKVSSISIIARWDFTEALKWKRQGKEKGYKRAAPTDPYLVKKRLPFPSSIVKAENPSVAMTSKNGTVFFRNGLQWNPTTNKAYFQTLDNKQRGRPSFIYRIQDGRFAQINVDGAEVAVASLVYEEDNTWKSVLAAPQIIESMLFRMYYFHGTGLKYFKPYAKARNPITGNWVFAYEVDWDLFNRSAS